MPATALQHFHEDIARSRAIVMHAHPLPQHTAAEQLLRGDLLRSAWMFSVGALDAYFSDAYTDLVAASVISKSRHPAMLLPDFFYEIRFPVRAILEPYSNNQNWRWRMAARQMMERENVLSLAVIQKLFNKFFRRGQRLFGDVLHAWMLHPRAKRRIFGITPAAYAAMTPGNQQGAREDALEQLQDRFRTIFQRRHDCVHNCDRPRVAPQRIVLGGTVLKVIDDIEFLVQCCDDHIQAEFRHFLLSCNCPAAVIGQVGY